MRESPADTKRAVVLSLLLHAALIALMFAGFLWERSSKTASAAGSPISAELIDANALSSSMQQAMEERPEPLPEPIPEPVAEPVPEPEPEPEPIESVPPPQPLPEPIPEDSPVPPRREAQEQVPDPAPVDQEEVRRDAISAETREREQEEKRRQEQIDLTERKRQEEAERRQRLAEQREKQLAEIRAERAKAKREAELLEEKQKQLANRRAQQASEAARTAEAPAPAAAAPPGNNGVDAGLNARYAAAIQEAILRNWTRPDNVPQGQRCRISIRQLPGGEVVSVDISPTCPYDDLGRRSVEAAVLKAQPLPYAGFEQVFQRNLTLNFEAADR